MMRCQKELRQRFGSRGCNHQLSTTRNTFRWLNISKKANKAPNTSEMVREAHTPVRPEPPIFIKMFGTR